MNWEELSQIAFCNNVEVLKLTDRLCKEVLSNKIQGSFAEAGTAWGAHCLVMNENAVGQKVYMFDSFEGISTHSDEDIEWTEVHGKGIADERKSGGITVCKIDDVKETMLRFVDNLNNFIFIKGWFIDTFPKLTDEKFSVLRLDCDLYLPYMLCFKHLLPRLQKGGYLIIDDYVLSGCQQAIKDSGLDINSFTIENNMAYLKWE